MSVLRHIVTAGGGLAVALMAPMIALQAQVVAPGTNPRTPTTNPAPTPAPNPAATPSQSVSNDLPFLREAAGVNLMEVRLGQLAQSKASNAAVKQFGQRMVDDHTRIEQDLSSMVSANGIALNPTLTSDQNDKINSLQSLSGPQFDQAYMSLMIQGHQTDVAEFENQSRNSDSPQVRDFAARSLPVLQQHLSLAQQVGRQPNVGVATAPPLRTPTRRAQSGQEALRADRDYIVRVMADNTLEVSMGELVERRAQNPAVRQFAERMVADHKRLEDEWVGMGARNGQPIKPGMGEKHRVKLTRLEKLSGRAFDRAYISHVVHDHRGHIGYFEREGRSAHSTQVREVVERVLPVWRSHFNEAKQIAGQIGADTTATVLSGRVSANR
jgi:putative membrane protein